ncbi:hypothetical protein [Clostridium beijerinckii]|jgi:hypothetical protein|uniref:Uncharacterized protein n=2 Tax=Clostridium beijerinckii TaxID=1520 RepID=A0AAE2RUE6_CLOBE|nr:hypothetical protein [Clostridium beijerinckii]ABR33539.1 hypothetical protein Cbei_1359 [Clostridium beijerinckii NCIMB 8052]AIU04856.1 hypothetical protein Cbs_1359 [Clostridium beijerinckii ATCC 35702]MBF7811955.1 hypothetical protein [Clostridium beijerinckii]NRT25194.1 hypothetical protein [Clostridium beijerinckii]NRT67212.1 hypothetical protein [Clostridium beijerinckii]
MAKEKRSPQSNLNKNLESMLSNSKLRHFVRWFTDGQDESKWEQLSKNYFNNISLDKAKELYLEKKDVQDAILYVTKFQKDLNLVKIYNSMMKKAIEGDTNAATWIIKFSESDFFDNKEDKLKKLTSRLKLNFEDNNNE